MLCGLQCVSVLGAVVREAADVWERRSDRQGEAGPECAVIIGTFVSGHGEAAGVAWPSASLPGTTRQPTRGTSDVAFSCLKDN